MWGAEVSLWWCSPGTVHLAFVRQGLSLAWGLQISPGGLASELQGSACLHGPSAGIMGCAAMCSFFCMAAGDGTAFLMLVWQARSTKRPPAPPSRLQAHTCNPAFEKLMPENYSYFLNSLGYNARRCLKNKNKSPRCQFILIRGAIRELTARLPFVMVLRQFPIKP